MTRAELKDMAKEQIRGKIGVLFLMSLAIIAISFLVGMIPAVGGLIVGWVFSPAFTIALIVIYLNITKGIKPAFGELFAHFDKLWIAIKVSFFTGLFTFLWSLLLIIPGIIKAYSYSMAMYIVAEDPEIGAREALKRSQDMMDGHKMELFVLNLSFLGWFLLGALTLGILYIWLIPYRDVTMANFYNSIKPASPIVDAPAAIDPAE